jgi:hypothetical protein
MAFAVIEKRTDKRKERTFGPLLDGLNLSGLFLDLGEGCLQKYVGYQKRKSVFQYTQKSIFRT